MLQRFSQAFLENWERKRTVTVVAIALHLLAVFVIAVLIEAVFWIGLVSFLFAVPVVIGVSYKTPMLGWFWGQDQLQDSLREHDPDEPRVEKIDKSPDSLASSNESNDVNASADVDEEYEEVAPTSNRAEDFEAIRQLPVGTRIVRQSDQEVVVTIKSAVRFWCWFAPSAFCALALIAIPIGGWLGFLIYEASLHQSWLLTSMCIGAAIWSYFSFRPWVKVTANAREIRFGDKSFDRRYTGGFRIGHKTSEADLRSSMISDRFGVTLLRLSYGPWGEDLKYLVDSYYASAIVIWLNDIVGSVGENEAMRYDPNAGRKIELL